MSKSTRVQIMSAFISNTIWIHKMSICATSLRAVALLPRALRRVPAPAPPCPAWSPCLAPPFCAPVQGFAFLGTVGGK